MQKNNILATEFLKKWHKDKKGIDIFTSNVIDFGHAFKIEMWTESFHYIRLRSNLEKLKSIKHEKLFLASKNRYINSILNQIGLSFNRPCSSATSKLAVYFFDDQEYMQTNLHGKTFKEIAKRFLVVLVSNLSFYYDDIFGKKIIKKFIFNLTIPHSQ
jgi:hypothetical protein